MVNIGYYTLNTENTERISMKRNISLKHKLILDNTQEMMIFFDRNGMIIECNKVAIHELGYGSEIYKVPIYQIFNHACHYNGKLDIVEEYLHKSEETIAYRKNQTCFPVELRISILSDRIKTIGICTAVNITDKKEASREIRSLNNEVKVISERRNEAMANLTHELRTPVNGIMGLSENLLGMELTKDQTELIILIKCCCSNMIKIINDILDYTKISNNKLQIEQREFNFRIFIHNIITIYKARINEKGLKLLVNIAEDIPDIVVGDELRLTQILNNLFSNAVKFTLFGQIALEVVMVAQTDNYLELFFMLIDTGIGISKEEKDKLFQSFTQVDGSISRRFGGTGLGLSISKKLIEAMNGSITVDSEKDKGSTFSFSIRLGLPTHPLENKKEEAVASTTTIEQASFLMDDPDNNLGYVRKHMLENDNSIKDISIYPKQEVKTVDDVMAVIDKLILCIEMESWDNAEQLATYIKQRVPENHGKVTKGVFRLLMAVRKENRDVALALIDEIKIMIKER